METQLTLGVWKNQNLFSNHYLDAILPTLPEWHEDAHSVVFAEILKLYNAEKFFLSTGMREAQLEERFYRPIFKRLGFEYEVQATDKTADFPDYALFKDRTDLDNAHRFKKTNAFYDNALAVGEVKKWDVELDKWGKDRQNKRSNPSFQIWLYLQETKPQWGILTNGRKWRLYHDDKPLDVYFEIDLVTMLETQDAEAFKFFYYFFRKDAFVARPDGSVFIDQVLVGSASYAYEVGENLKENVYKAMRIISQGFLERQENKLRADNADDLKRIQHNSMRLLYRFLFILYAEGKGLLSDQRYYDSDYSLYRLKQEIAEKVDGGAPFMPRGTLYWTRLKNLFELINAGSESAGVNREQFYVPPYNGGLFDASKNPFLDQKILGDKAIAEAIDLLARSRTNGLRGFVDYSTLEIRHLGSIYEGLLEFSLKSATERMVAAGNKLAWKTYDEYARKTKKPKLFEEFSEENRAEPGELYLTTSGGERKATGSYYTPQYVVNYIVQSAIDPIVRSKWEEAYLAGHSYRDAVLSIKVLDPSMGSGHFLVGATEYLAAKLMEAIKQDANNGLVDEAESEHLTSDWAKREVVSRCIYGVDLNEMAVELAKVSLWLNTISKEKPLNFLDHHLKCGNSLVGDRLAKLRYYPGSKVRDEHGDIIETIPSVVSDIFIEKLIAKIKELEKVGDDAIGDVKRKEKILDEFKHLPEYEKSKAIADVHTSVYFGNDLRGAGGRAAKDAYYDLIYALNWESNWATASKAAWFTKARSLAEKNRFFHWELEFPDIFFEGGSLKENPGFDVVIGNPPYVRAETADKAQRKFIMDSGTFSTVFGRFDLYPVFIELGLELARRSGTVAMIVPAPILAINYGTKLREFMLKQKTIRSVVDLRRMEVFKGVGVETCVLVIDNRSPPENYLISYETQVNRNNTQIIPIHAIAQDTFLDFYNFMMRVDLPPSALPLKKIIETKTIPLGDICYCITGVVAHDSETGESKDRLIHDIPVDETCKPYIEAKEWNGRYSTVRSSRFIEYKPEKMHRPKFPELFESKKILIQGISSSPLIPATLDTSGVYCNHSLNCCVKLEDVIKYGTALHLDNPKVQPDSNYSLEYVLALMNSKLMGFYHFSFVSNDLGIFPETVRMLPLKPVAFKTRQERREAEVRRLHSTLETNPGDLAPIASELIKKGCLDVIHDFLRDLVIMMVTTRREADDLKNQFIEWMESSVGLGLNVRLMKHSDVFLRLDMCDISKPDECRTNLESVLGSNHVKLSGVQLASFRQELSLMLEKMNKLHSKTELLDVTIDVIVFQLYGLKPSDIRIIESRIGG